MAMIPIYCLTLNHKRAPIRVLESFTLGDLQSALTQLKGKGANECVIVQTCHRIEIYALGSNVNGELLKAFLRNSTNSVYPIEPYAEVFEGEEAIRHLFYLAAGLESIIVGETEIMHQVRESLQLAKNLGTANTIMESIFSAALNCGRVVRRKTPICRGSISLGSLVMKTITKELGSLDGKKLVIIGAGKIGSIIAKSIPRKGTLTIFVANRTYSRAERLASEVGGRAVSFDRLKEVIADADAVVCATSSPHLVLTKKDLEGLRRLRLLIVDVSNPRGVDEKIKYIDGIKLIDLEQITNIAKRNIKVKKKAIEEAKEIVENSLSALMERLKFSGRKMGLEMLMRWAEHKRRSAIDIAFRRCTFTDDQKKVIEEFTYAFMRDIIMPLSKLGVELNGFDSDIHDQSSRVIG